jgi:hypothetical protein
MMNVVIVPPPGLNLAEKLHRKWGQQYAAADPSQRTIEYLDHVGPASVIAATQKAAIKAGPLGTVIYACGHGGILADKSDGHFGYVDFAPMRHFRVTQFEIFYEVKTDWQLDPVKTIEKDLKKRLKTDPNHPVNRKQAIINRKHAIQRWCKEYKATRCESIARDLLNRKKLQKHYEELCSVYQKHPVQMIVPLVCNIGNAREFLDEMSSDLSVPVKGFTRTVRSHETNGKVRFYLDGDLEGMYTNIPEACTELMPNADPDDYYIGVVNPVKSKDQRTQP